MGGGESGTGAAILAKKLGYDVFLSDKGRLGDAYRDVLEREGICWEEGGHTEKKILAADLVVKSPGIPDSLPLVAILRRQGIEVISEIEWAGRHSDARMICITGSNGKTTTTLLLWHLLNRAGKDAGLAGNVGNSLAAQVATGSHKMYVVELSSFQLDGIYHFKADIAILTNITPDHLDRYGYCFENYVDSKFRILNNMDPQGLFIFGSDSGCVQEKVQHLAVVPETAAFTYTGKPKSENGAWMEGAELVARLDCREFRIHRDRISLRGRHNLYNAMAAVLAAMRIGLNDEEIADGLESFPQVEHRLETVAVKKGVTYINDSKATNVDSAWYALDSMTGPVVWIAGGTDKGNDYLTLEALVKQKVKVLVAMGTDNQKLLQAFSGICPVEDTHSLAAAMEQVQRYAVEGDTVLLSPCCASFDLFRNYEDRGRQFKEQVNKL